MDGLATVADIATELWAADPDTKGNPHRRRTCPSHRRGVSSAAASAATSWPARQPAGVRPAARVQGLAGAGQRAVRIDGHGASRGPAAATLRVMSGPDVGREFSLPSGTSYIGRDRDVDIRLTDPLTSKRHARITVGESVEIVDTNSANGLLMDGLPVTRATLELLGHRHAGRHHRGRWCRCGDNQAAARRRRWWTSTVRPRVVPRFESPKRVLAGRPQAAGTPPVPVHHADCAAADGRRALRRHPEPAVRALHG